MSDAGRPSKNERRSAARAKALEQREVARKRQRRNRLLVQGAVAVVILLIVGIVTAVITSAPKPSAAGPSNMVNGGLTVFGASYEARRTAPASASATPTPEPLPTSKVRIQIWEDFGCPVCGAFEQTNGAFIKQLVASNAAEVQYFPVAILDRAFVGRNYSTAAANAAAAVANYSPDSYQRFVDLMFSASIQPEEGSSGLTNDQLVKIIQRAGAKNIPSIRKAISEGTYNEWVAARTSEFVANGGALRAVKFPSSRTGAGTPTVVVNGQYYDGPPNDAGEFGSFVTRVGGE